MQPYCLTYLGVDRTFLKQFLIGLDFLFTYCIWLQPLVPRSLCNLFFPFLQLKYSLCSKPKLEDRQFESMAVSPVLVREEKEEEQETGK